MTPQQAIQKFMAKLVDHGYSYSDSVGTAMLDAAANSASEFSNVQAVINAMKADQVSAEKEAVEEILGSDYAGKTLSEISSDILSADAKTYDTANKGNAYYNSANDQRTTVERLIKERKATIFLEKYCGIQLASKCWINSSDNVTYWSGVTSGNDDTGAITGSDANITLAAGDVVGNVTLTADNLQTLKTNYGSAASLSSDGQTIIIGTGTEKTDRSIVPEIGNKYTATTAQAQNIKTGSNDWIVVATSANDTIQTGGADSVNAGAGNDSIVVGADYASILTGAGNDTVAISAEVKNVTLGDLNSSDVLTISGTFEVGSAQIEDTLLVITDKTGTRKIRLGDFDTAKNAKINSTTIGAWLTNAGINLNNLNVSSSSNELPTSSAATEISDGGEGQIAIDPDYTPTPIETAPTIETSDGPTRSSSSTGTVNVNLDNVTLTSGDLQADGSKVGEISNEFPNVTSYTKNGLTINLIGTTSNTDGYPDNFTSKTYDQLTDDQKTIVAGLFKWWGKECLQLNEESYGISFNSSTAMVKEIGLYFYDGNGSSNTLAAVWNWSTSGTRQDTTQLMLNINMDYYAGITEDNLDGESSKSSAGLLDRTLAHEFTHAMMATNIHYFNWLPKFIKEGMAELTHGIDDFRPTNIFKIAYDADWLNASLDLGNTGTGNQSIGDGYSGGYMFLRYFAKQAALQSVANEVNPLLITLTENADAYNNTLAGATIQALDGNDSITNSGASVYVDGGLGNDYLYNTGLKVTITGGDGDDTIRNEHNVGSPLGGSKLDDDDDSNNDLTNTSNDYEILLGGAGNDYIINGGNSVTIDGGNGDDYISNSGSNVTFIYAKGDGKDTIYGFNETSTLQIGNGTATYSTVKSGSDIIVTVGDGLISLVGAASLSTLNINGKMPSLTIKEGQAIYGTTGETLFTIYGISSAAKLSDFSISGTDVTISKNALGEDNVFLEGEGYTLKLASDVPKTPTTVAGAWSSLLNGKATYTTTSYTAYYTLEDNSVIYNGASGGEQFTLSGVKSIASTAVNVNEENKVVTLFTAALGTDKITLDGDDYSLNLDTTVAQAAVAGEKKFTALTNGTATYKIFGDSAYYTLDGNDVYYTPATADKTFTISGLTSNLTLTNGAINGVTATVNGDSVKFTLSAAALKASNVTVSGTGATLELGSDVPKTAQNVNDWETLTSGNVAYLEGGKTSYYSLNSDSKSVAYTAPVDGTNKVELSGVKGTPTLSGSTVNLNANNFNSNVAVVSNAGNYQFALSGAFGGKKFTGTSGADTITNSGSNISIDGGAGNDYINNNAASNVTVNTAQGNDTIKLGAAAQSFRAEGFGAGDVIELAATATNLTTISGGIKAGNVSISGVTNIATVNNYWSTSTNSIAYNQSTVAGAKLSGNLITYDTTSGTSNLFTISGIKSTTGVTLSGKEVTLSKTALNGITGTVSISGGDYKLKLASDVDTLAENTSGWTTLTNGNVAYLAGGKGSYYSLSSDGKSVTYNTSVAGSNKVELSGVKGTPTLSGSTVNLNADNFNSNVAVISNAGNYQFSLSGAFGNKKFTGTSGADTIANSGSNVSIDGAAGNDYISNNAASNITINTAQGNDTIKLGSSVQSFKTEGFSAGDVIELASTASNLTTISGGIKAGNVSISGVNDIATVNNSWSTSTNSIAYNQSTVAGAKLSGSLITYDSASGTSNLFTISGIKSTTGVTLSGKEVTLGKAALNGITGTVSISGGDYKLKLASDVDTVAENTSGWTTLTNGNVAYLEGGKGSYYSLSSDGKSVTYNTSVAGSNKVELSGVKGTPTLSGSTVNLTADNFNSNVSVVSNAGNYQFSLSGALGGKKFTGTSGADTITNSGSNISIDGSAGNDFISNNAASNVTINTAQGNDTIKLGSSVQSFRAEGFGAGDVIELAATATNLTTISGGIKAGNVSISGVNGIATVNSSWSTSTNSIAYNQSTVAGAKLSGNLITYDTTSGTSNLFTISGIKSTTGVTLSGKEVTLSKAALNAITGTVSITGGDYKLKLASDVDTVAENTSGWTTLTNGNVAYLEGGKGSYYSLSSDGKSVSYNTSVAGSNKVELSGVKGTPTLSGSTVNLNADNFNSNVSVVSNAGNYQFSLSGSLGNKKFTGTSGADTITNSGSNISIDGAAGNDTITNSGANVTLTGGAGNDVFAYSKGSFKVTDYTASADKVSLDIAKVDDVALSNKDVVLGLGQGSSVTIANGKDKKITVADKKTAQYIFGNHVILNAGKTSATLTSAATNFSATSYSALATINATGTNSATKVTGNDKANVIKAGANGSTLNGGKANDTLYGGAGVDIFVYEKNTGNDVIQNFTSGKDKISLGAGASVTGFSVTKAGDARLKVGSNNLTIKKAAGENISTNGKKITIIDASGKETTQTFFTNQAVAGKGVTLYADYSGNFTASSSVVNVDASQSENPLVLKGNKNNNFLTGGADNDSLSGGKGNDVLKGGAGKDTLSGGAGNDSLTGGKGKDLFVFGGGKDVITDYNASDDKISVSKTLGAGSYKVSGKNVVLTYGDNSLTINNALNKKLSVTNGASGTYTKSGVFNSKKTAVTLPAATKTFKATSYSKLVTVDASAATSTINVTGNKLANYFIAGSKGSTLDGGKGNDVLKGGTGKDSLIGGNGNDSLYGGKGADILRGNKGNDTLWGGAGNDSLYGGSGNDVFIYKAGEGTDKIFDYSAGDMLQILKSNGKAGSFTKSKYSGGTLTLTIKGGGSVILDGVAKGDTFNINNKTYKISGSKLK